MGCYTANKQIQVSDSLITDISYTNTNDASNCATTSTSDNSDDSDDSEDPNLDSKWYYTIDELFDKLLNYTSPQTYSINVVFDPEFGYPKYFAIDQDQWTADEEFGWTISNVIKQDTDNSHGDGDGVETTIGYSFSTDPVVAVTSTSASTSAITWTQIIWSTIAIDGACCDPLPQNSDNNNNGGLTLFGVKYGLIYLIIVVVVCIVCVGGCLFIGIRKGKRKIDKVEYRERVGSVDETQTGFNTLA